MKKIFLTLAIVLLLSMPSHSQETLPAAQDLIRVLNNEKIEYKLEFDKLGNVVVIDFQGDNISQYTIRALFEKENPDLAKIAAYDFVSVKNVQSKEKILKLINTLNQRYSFAKFIYDDKAKTLDLTVDARFSNDVKGKYVNRGQMAYKLIDILSYICNDCYPALMRAIWN